MHKMFKEAKRSFQKRLLKNYILKRREYPAFFYFLCYFKFTPIVKFMNIESIITEYFEREKSLVIFFSHKESMLCGKMKPDLIKVIKKFSYVDYLEVDVSKSNNVVSSFGITSIPTLTILRKDIVIATKVGKLNYKEIYDFISVGSNITEKIAL